jgi:hypothetical protein
MRGSDRRRSDAKHDANGRNSGTVKEDTNEKAKRDKTARKKDAQGGSGV